MKTRTLIPLLFLVAATSSLAQERAVQPVTFEKLTDRLYEIRGGRGANSGAYIGDNGVLLIDAKMDEDSVRGIFEGLQAITDQPVRYLVNSHSDADHTGGNRYLPGTVTIVAHENCRKEFLHPGRDGSPSMWANPELAPFLPAVTFREKMDLYLGGKKAECWYFGVGHTTGDAVVNFPGEKIAFIGDQAFPGRPQLIHSYKGGNSFAHVRNLERMLETLDAERFSIGHGDIVDRTDIRRHIETMKQRQAKVGELLRAGKSLADVQGEFPENEARLIESIYTEIENGKTR